MAVTIQLYNHTPKLFGNAEINLSGMKVMLLNNSATFTAANTSVSSVSSNQVSGNGWTAGGITLAGVTVAVSTTNDATLDANDIVVTATGGAIGPAFKAVIYDDAHASDLLVAFIDFGGSQEAGVGTDFRINWNASGIITWTNAA